MAPDRRRNSRLQGAASARPPESPSTRSNMFVGRPRESVIFYTLTMVCCGLAYLPGVQSTAPAIDYSHNMRILKLPKSTPLGSIVYRLRASDADANSHLSFSVVGIEARSLLDVQQTPGSWNEADVYLRSSLADSLGQQYNMSVQVSDGNTSTQVQSTLLVTEDGESLSPFVNARHVFQVPENTEPDEAIGQVQVLESRTNDLPVRFELRGKGSERFSIRYMFGPRGQSRGELLLAQKLDYEHQNLYTLQVLALNPWTDDRVDTRNLASLDIVVAVQDVQDMPPVFERAPRSVALATDMQAGHLLARLHAEDADGSDQRPINYALDAESPASSYFSLDKQTGELRLAKPVAELLLHTPWDSPAWSVLGVFATEQLDPGSYEHLWPPMFTRIELPLVLVDTKNEPPLFVGGWQTAPGAGDNQGAATLHGFVQESSQPSLLVSWYTNATRSPSTLVDELVRGSGGRPSVLDLGLGANGTFELSLSGRDAALFHLEPAFPVAKQTAFWLSVSESTLDRNRSLFDRETETGDSSRVKSFQVDIVAKDFGSPQRLSSLVHCVIELVDSNDMAPAFETDLFVFTLFENSQPGHLVGQVRARDLDSSEGGRVRYTSLVGMDSQLFRLDSESGRITLEGALDREKRNQFLFLVEARDFSGLGNSNRSQVLINVLDVNDNAPVFLQTHYDAVLLADCSFQQPLQVRALDNDEPGSANSQVAYEIIAGNQNDQFSIDPLTGVIDVCESRGTLELPPALTGPILPFAGHPESAGKIHPGSREVEENSPGAASERLVRQNHSRALDWAWQQRHSAKGWPRSTGGSEAAGEPGHNLSAAARTEQVAGSELLINMESGGVHSFIRSVSPASSHASALKVAPLTTLVVRAHDFGVPVKSSTVKVNIYNQALVSRSVSLILNGTLEQLEPRREQLERAYGSLTGSRVSLDSLEALSDSSSLSLARVRLAVPQHSLVDLTDLGALLEALDLRPASPSPAAGDKNQRLVPGSQAQTPSNLSQAAQQQQQQQQQLYSELQGFALEASTLEKRLLIYIIIVAVCILALLVIWMIYSCSREEHEQRLVHDKWADAQQQQQQQQQQFSAADTTVAKTAPGRPIANQLTGKTGHKSRRLPSAVSSALLPLAGGRLAQASDHSSMYNGQVWFEPGGRSQKEAGFERRVSSARSASSLESAGDTGAASRAQGQQTAMEPGSARSASGQFFPNALGYVENLAALTDSCAHQNPAASKANRLNRRHKVAPLVASGDELEPVRAGEQPAQPARSLQRQPLEPGDGSGAEPEVGGQVEERAGRRASSAAGGSSCAGSLNLNSDQELLGYDHSRRPIVATRAANGDTLVIDMLPRLARQAELPDKREEAEKSGTVGTPEEAPALAQDGPAPQAGAAASAAELEQAEGQAAELEPEASRSLSPPLPPPLLPADESEAARGQTASAAPRDSEKGPQEGKAADAKQVRLISELNERLGGRRSPEEAAEGERGSLSSAGSSAGSSASQQLADMRNGELLQRQSIFAITYGGLAASELPA